MAKRTIENCMIIRNNVCLGVSKPYVFDEKCEGYNTKYYSPDCKHATCDKCKLNVKYTERKK